jgi:hypothetical protein
VYTAFLLVSTDDANTHHRDTSGIDSGTTETSLSHQHVAARSGRTLH